MGLSCSARQAAYHASAFSRHDFEVAGRREGDRPGKDSIPAHYIGLPFHLICLTGAVQLSKESRLSQPCRDTPKRTTGEELDRLYQIHCKGAFFLTQKLLPLINDGGRIVNVSSGLTRITMPGSVPTLR